MPETEQPTIELSRAEHLRHVVAELNPSETASILDEVDIGDARNALARMDARSAAPIIARLSDDTAVEVLVGLPPAHAMEIIREITSDVRPRGDELRAEYVSHLREDFPNNDLAVLSIADTRSTDESELGSYQAAEDVLHQWERDRGPVSPRDAATVVAGLAASRRLATGLKRGAVVSAVVATIATAIIVIQESVGWYLFRTSVIGPAALVAASAGAALGAFWWRTRRRADRIEWRLECLHLRDQPSTSIEPAIRAAVRVMRDSQRQSAASIYEATDRSAAIDSDRTPDPHELELVAIAESARREADECFASGKRWEHASLYLTALAALGSASAAAVLGFSQNLTDGWRTIIVIGAFAASSLGAAAGSIGAPKKANDLLTKAAALKALARSAEHANSRLRSADESPLSTAVVSDTEDLLRWRDQIDSVVRPGLGALDDRSVSVAATKRAPRPKPVTRRSKT